MAVGGQGVDPDTTVLGVNLIDNLIEFGDTGDPVVAIVDVADGLQLSFAQRGFNSITNILPGSLSGVIYQGNMATEEFSVARRNVYFYRSRSGE